MKAFFILAAATTPLLALCLAASQTVPAPHSAAVPPMPPGNQLYVSNYENVLGTSLQLKIVASSEARAKQAKAAALAEIDREAAILSSWDSSSEFSRWFRTMDRPVPISPELFEVLALFDRWRGLTHGALDASAEEITRVWLAAAAHQQLPSQAALDAAAVRVRMTHWKLDAAGRTATHTSDVPLAMNSFVKGYIVGRAAGAALKVTGVQAVVVNIGGDLVVRGQWSEPVDIADPQSDAENGTPIARLLVRDRAVATSGDYRRGFLIGGRHYSHIVDPRTGMPADDIISSTVVALNPADAGALATAFSVMSPEESRRLAASIPGVEYLLVDKNGQQIMSQGWKALAVPVQTPVQTSVQTNTWTPPLTLEARLAANGQAPAQPSQQSPASNSTAAKTAPPSALLWNRQYELTISLEVSHIEGRRITRPFVAVWIEDEQRTPVRTIALWYGSLRYLPELKAWYRDEDLGLNPNQDLNYINSVSSATRPPGAYTLKWDGRADNGKLVKPGKYTVLIEASREHGTYQLIRQEMDFNGTPSQFQLPGNIEIASASVDYHKIDEHQTKQ